MAYPAISSRRMPYDIDGTEIGYGTIGAGIIAWFTSNQKILANDENYVNNKIELGSGRGVAWFFFPEKREIEAIYTRFAGYQVGQLSLVEGSNDSTNGLDGVWETASMSGGYPAPVNNFSWRDGVKPVSFSESKKILRLRWGASDYESDVQNIHLYGRKAAGETPDDILFCDASTGAEKTALMDWGDQPEGTTEIDSFKVKNASASKIANDINLQLNHDDFLLAWSPDGPWTATLDIATLGVGALSNTIYVRNKLGPPLLILGPYAARVIASVGSWT